MDCKRDLYTARFIKKTHYFKPGTASIGRKMLMRDLINSNGEYITEFVRSWPTQGFENLELQHGEIVQFRGKIIKDSEGDMFVVRPLKVHRLVNT